MIALFDLQALSTTYSQEYSWGIFQALSASSWGYGNTKYAKLNGKTISWYYSNKENGAMYQLNNSGTVYNWVVIG